MEMIEIANKSRASQNKKELAILLALVKQIDPKVIVEIGVHQGYSMQTWKQAFPEAQVIGIENDTHAIDREATKDCYIIEADSHETDTQYSLLGNLRGNKIDFLFIDGDHSYDGVKRDWQLYVPLVSSGIVALHDIAVVNNEHVQVYKFWQEVKKNSQTVDIVIENGTGVIYL